VGVIFPAGLTRTPQKQTQSPEDAYGMPPFDAKRKMLFGDPSSGSSPAELISLRRTLGRSSPIVLVTED
jgi:hypothetical protein